MSSHPKLSHPLLKQGIQHHVRNELLKAAECYRQVYLQEPANVEALLLLSIAARDTRQYAASLELARIAARKMPNAAHYQLNLAMSLYCAGMLQEAKERCDHALTLEPASVRGWCTLGEIECARKELIDARKAYLYAANLPGGAALAALGLGNMLSREEKFEEAMEVYARGLRCSPRDANLCFSFGAAAQILERRSLAKSALARAIELRPKFAEAHLQLGNLFYDEESFPLSAICYWRAIEVRPNYSKAFCNLGNAMMAMQRNEEAIACLERALAIEPAMHKARHNLGNAFLAGREYLRAEECFRSLMELEPLAAEHHIGLGNSLLQQFRLAEAEIEYREAAAMKPDLALAHANLANALFEEGRYDESFHHSNLALDLDPECAGANYNHALFCLRQGRYAEGWPRHESRWRFRELRMRPRSFPQPQWTGPAEKPVLAGKRLLIHAEQGLGDSIQFLRYLPRLRELGARTLLEVQPPLLRMLEQNPLAEQVVTYGDPLPEFDLHCPMMSLPLAFGTTLTTIPNPSPYLSAAPQDIEAAWQRFPRQPRKMRIGVVWAGNPRHKRDSRRSMPLAALASLFELEGIDWFSLQAGEPALAQLGSFPQLIDACSTSRDIAETAGVVATMDLVLSVDTSIAHLAGAMAKPVWIMLPRNADWRWLIDREDSPWYPTARLFRQAEDGEWALVVERMKRVIGTMSDKCNAALKEIPQGRVPIYSEFSQRPAGTIPCS